MTNWPKYLQNQRRLRWWLLKLASRQRSLTRDKITGKRAHEWQDKHLREHDAKAAAVNQQEIDAIRPHIAAWERSVAEALAQVHKYRVAIEKERPKPPATPSGEGYTRIARPWNPYRKPIANWIIPILDYAHAHGWTGYVVSGVRSRAEQWIAATKYGLWHYPGGNPFLTNHMKWIWPGGAVDVTNAPQLHSVLQAYHGARKLLWGLATMGFDEPHFSGNGH